MAAIATRRSSKSKSRSFDAEIVQTIQWRAEVEIADPKMSEEQVRVLLKDIRYYDSTDGMEIKNDSGKVVGRLKKAELQEEINEAEFE